LGNYPAAVRLEKVPTDVIDIVTHLKFVCVAILKRLVMEWLAGGSGDFFWSA